MKMKHLLKSLFSSPFLLLFISFSALVPTFFSLLYFFEESAHLKQLEGRALALKAHQSFIKHAKIKENERLFSLQRADPAYIQKQLESFFFLEKEKRKLEILASDRCIQRLHFLKEGENSLRLIERNSMKIPPFQETELRLDHSIEMDCEDLKELLKRIEEVKAPELVIKEFELTRKLISPQEEVYLVNFNLIKKEALHE